MLPEGREFIHIGMDSLLADHSLPDVIYEVRVAANEPAVQSGNSTVVVTLKRNDPNILCKWVQSSLGRGQSGSNRNLPPTSPKPRGGQSKALWELAEQRNLHGDAGIFAVRALHSPAA